MVSRRSFVSSMAFLTPLRAWAKGRWPQFRGPGSRGVATDNPELPETWSATENVAWKREIPGKGWSSPIAWGNRIFVTSCLGPRREGPPPSGFYEGGRSAPVPRGEHRWMVYALDLDSGEIVWRTEVHRGVPPTPRHRKNTYASETPVTDGERVYAHFADLGTYCLDRNGKLLWSKAWSPLETRYGYGPGASPALHEGRLYILNDNEQQSFLAALDKLSGKEIWRVKRDEPTTWSTPYVWKNELRTEIITAGRNKVRSYDLDGKALWEISGMSGISIPTPFSGHGLVFIASGFRVSSLRPIYVVRPGASGDITPPKGQNQNRHIAWSEPQGAPYHPSPLLYGDYYYTLFDGGFLTCHEAKTGKQVYGKQRIEVGAANFTASPWAYNGKLFSLNEAGDTYVIQAGPQFKMLGKNTLGEMCMATPAVAGDSLIIRTYSNLYRIAKSA